MSKTTNIVVAVVIVAAVAVGAVALSGKSSEDKNGNTTSSDTASAAITVTYGEDGFSPVDTTIASGGKVKFVNNTDATIEPSSDPHPVHTDNPELNAGDIEPGESKTLTLTTKGDWGYHNHYKNTDRATITVE